MRLAVFMKDKCQPKQCAPSLRKPCIVHCPRNRTGYETIVLNKDTGFPELNEALCTGCGICVKKCPFHCYQIVNVPDMLKNQITFRYAPDGFALFRMIIPKKGKILGLIGQNGIGKSTALKILSGELKMNLGRFEKYGEKTPDWDDLIKFFRGSELQPFLIALKNKSAKVVHKPQNIMDIPKVVKGKVGEILKKIHKFNSFDYIIKNLSLDKLLDRQISQLSGGELQKFAIAAALLRQGDLYLFDEPTSYLDVKERLNVAHLINSLSDNNKTIVLVEHDLAILDYLSDYVSLIYGKPGAYGIISRPHGVRVGINVYLSGYIKDENMRFRPKPIVFETRPPNETLFTSSNVMFEYPDMIKTMGSFKLTVYGGEIHIGEVIGILGPNGIGKTTFLRLLAKELKPDFGDIDYGNLKLAIKPQYISSDPSKSVEDIILSIKMNSKFEAPYKRRIVETLDLESIKDRKLDELSGGELQRVALAECLTTDADIFLIDEPSAFLDIEMRLQVALLIRKSIEEIHKCAFVVEHDIITQDFISDSIIVFEGEPGVEGYTTPPQDLRSGMNTFLKSMDITFRRDNVTGRPRVNKKNSRLDKYQKSIGEYYFTKIEKIDEEIEEE
ncbi:MAG: ribosome biogenesis/translation initiation ATPase RLI [Promethearchaeota archaeon]